MLVALQRHTRLRARKREGGRGAPVGGVPRFGLHLQHWPGVDLDEVAGL